MADQKVLTGSDLGLSKREQVVLSLLAEGRTNKAMARELDIRESTVKAHISNIMKLLGCRNRTQVALLGFCIERRLHDQTAQLISKLAIRPTPRSSVANRESLAG